MHETGTGQQVAQLHERLMMIMIIIIISHRKVLQTAVSKTELIYILNIINDFRRLLKTEKGGNWLCHTGQIFVGFDI